MNKCSYAYLFACQYTYVGIYGAKIIKIDLLCFVSFNIFLVSIFIFSIIIRSLELASTSVQSPVPSITSNRVIGLVQQPVLFHSKVFTSYKNVSLICVAFQSMSHDFFFVHCAQVHFLHLVLL